MALHGATLVGPGQCPYEPSIAELRVPHARRLGPACPRTPKSQSAAFFPHPWDMDTSGSVDGGTAASFSRACSPGDLLPVPPVLLLRDPIHAYRCVGTLPAIGAFEAGTSNQMRQRVEPSFGSLALGFTTFTCPGVHVINVEALAMVPSLKFPSHGGLCSAGSRPRRSRLRRSYARPRLPAPSATARFPLAKWPTSWGSLFMPQGPTTRAPANVAVRRERGHRLSVTPGCVEERRGPPRLRGLSFSYVPWSNTPPETPPSLPRRYVCRGCMAFR